MLNLARIYNKNRFKKMIVNKIQKKNNNLYIIKIHFLN